VQDSPGVGNWAEFTFAKASGSVTKDREKHCSIAERRVTSNDPRNNCGTHFDSGSLLVSKVVNGLTCCEGVDSAFKSFPTIGLTCNIGFKGKNILLQMSPYGGRVTNCQDAPLGLFKSFLSRKAKNIKMRKKSQTSFRNKLKNERYYAKELPLRHNVPPMMTRPQSSLFGLHVEYGILTGDESAAVVHIERQLKLNLTNQK